MARSRLMHWILCCLVVAAVGVAGCSTDTTTSGESTGSLDLNLELAPGVVINEVNWVISRPLMEDMEGTIDTSAPGATASVEVFGLPPGDGYTVTLIADVEDQLEPCIGSADFSVEIGVSTPVMVMLNCKRPERLGGVRVNGKFNVCADLAKVIVSPLQTSVGNQIDLSALGVDVDDDQEDIQYLWSASTGIIKDPGMRVTTYTCTEVIDEETITIRISDDWDFCMDEWDVKVKCVEGDGGNLCDDVPACIPDGNECTETECNPLSGECETTNLDGEDCDGGNGMCVEDDCQPKDLCIDKPPCDDTDCTDGVCVPATGNCVDKPINEGEDCEEGSGVCNAEGECIPKATCEDDQCPDTGNDCTVSKCSIALDKCVEMDVPNNMDCMVDDIAGKCSEGKCVVSNLCEPDPCIVVEQCVEDGTCDPADGSCTPGGNSPEGADCSIGGVVCDGDGNCVDCNEPGDCTEDVGQCSVKTCMENACGKVPGNNGDPRDRLGIGDGQCMGGECVEPPQCDDLNPCPDDGLDCTTVACIGGECVSGDVGAGEPCADGVCDGKGMCVECLDVGDCEDNTGQCSEPICNNSSMCDEAPLGETTTCDLDGTDDGVCDGSGTCVDCVVDGDCGIDQACIANACVSDPDIFCDTDICATDAQAKEDCRTAFVLCIEEAVLAEEECILLSLLECNECNEDSDCVEGEMCVGNVCMGGGVDPDPQTENITVACGNNVTGDVSILPYELTVDPGTMSANQAFTADLGGVAEFSEVFLDAAQGAVPGGVTKAGLVDLKATVQTRGGASGADVALGAGSGIPFECWFFDTGPGAQQPCDPANDFSSIPGFRPNSDCVIELNQNPCTQIVSIPISDDCAAGQSPPGVCEALDKLDQCANNSFCVTGGLIIDLDPGSGTYMAGASGSDALFGWYDDPPSAVPAIGDPAIDGDDTWNINQVAYTGVAGPIGLPVYAGLSVQLECIMATDSEPAIPNDAFPTEDADLISFPVP